MEYVKIEIPKQLYTELILEGRVTHDQLKEVTIKDDLFNNDSIWDGLKKASIKAYKNLKEYEFNKRHNVKPNN